MAKIEITDDCSAPDKYHYLKYSGPNPWAIFGKVAGTLKPFFHVSSSGLCNSRINWDIAGDVKDFYSTWWVKKEFSGYTTMWFHIKVQGVEGKTDKKGEFTLRLNADLETSFSGWGIFLKPVWYMYSYLFYDRARRTYLKKCNTLLLNFMKEIKEHFNLGVTQVPTAEGTYG